MTETNIALEAEVTNIEYDEHPTHQNVRCKYVTVRTETGGARVPVTNIHVHNLPAGWDADNIHLTPDSEVCVEGYHEDEYVAFTVSLSNGPRDWLDYDNIRMSADEAGLGKHAYPVIYTRDTPHPEEYSPIVQQAMESAELSVDDTHNIITIVDDYIPDDSQDDVTPSTVRAAILVGFTDPMAECRDNGEPRRERDGAALYGGMPANRNVLSMSGLFDEYDGVQKEILLERVRDSVKQAFSKYSNTTPDFEADYPYIVLDWW